MVALRRTAIASAREGGAGGGLGMSSLPEKIPLHPIHECVSASATRVIYTHYHLEPIT